MLKSRPPHTSSGAMTSETTDMSLMRMFMDGPEVSFSGSPTVSPTTAALCASPPFSSFGEVSPLDVFLGVVPGAAGVGHEQRQQHARDQGRRPASHPAPPGPDAKPTATGTMTATSPGTTISLMAARVEMSTQLAASGLTPSRPFQQSRGFRGTAGGSRRSSVPAALPTAVMVMAPMRYGIRPPMKRPTTTSGEVTRICNGSRPMPPRARVSTVLV